MLDVVNGRLHIPAFFVIQHYVDGFQGVAGELFT